MLGWLSCVRGASPSGTRGAGRRESHFGGRHRTSRYRIRCLQGVHGSRGTRRGTRRPDIDSRPLGAVFIRIRSRSCIDRSSSRVPRHAHPAALCPPQGEERSDQIKAAGATRDPRRPKWSVVNSQGHGDHPAAASRRRTPSYKFTSTRLRTLTPPPPHAPCAPLALTTCAPSVPHATAGLTSPSGECSACASPIFVESASPPGTACAALRALFLLCTGPTRFDARSSRGRRPERTLGEHPHVIGLRVAAWGRSPDTRAFYPRVIPPQNMPTARPRARALRPVAASCRPSASG